MNSLFSDRLRGVVAVVLAAAVVTIGVRPALAKNNDEPVIRPGATSGSGPSTTAGTDQNPPSNGEKSTETSTAPQLQIQDEGPPIDSSEGVKLSSRSKTARDTDTEERPFWKSWIFWAVTGALVVGGISMIAYSSSRTNSALAACPADIVVSLGCFGAGRGQ